MALIEITGLEKKYGEDFSLVVDRLSVEKGSITGIVGNNGAGKTTLLRLLLDLTEATGGEVVTDGIAVAGSDSWKSFTGSYLDEGFLIDFLTPEEYFYFTGRLCGLDAKAVEEKLRGFSRFLWGEVMGRKKYIRELSSGNRQKAGIVAAMITGPRLLILDEPFNFLDPSSQILIRRLLEEENSVRGTTIVLSSHNLAHMSGLCTRLLLLEKGRIIRDLSPPADDLSEVEAYFKLQAG